MDSTRTVRVALTLDEAVALLVAASTWLDEDEALDEDGSSAATWHPMATAAATVTRAAARVEPCESIRGQLGDALDMLAVLVSEQDQARALLRDACS